MKKPEGTLIVAVENVGTQGGMTHQVEDYGGSVLSAVQEHLVAVSPEGKLVPQLAEWEMSPDGKVITFHLRKGVQFHDGWGELTAEDVKFTMEKMMTEKGAINPTTSTLRDGIGSIETPDRYTVVLKMKKVMFDFLHNINNNPPHFTIASKKHIESVGMEQASKHPIGTGPWKFVEYKAADYVKFEAVENHWRKTPEFKYLILKEVPDPASRVMMLRAGDVDIIGVPLASLQEVEQAGFKMLASKGHPLWVVFGGLYLPTRDTFNPNLPWVGKPDDPVSWERALKVRKAMSLAIDKEKILRTVLRGKGAPAVVPGMRDDQPGYNPNWKPYPYDPEAARKLLVEAGYAKGFPVTVKLFSLPGRGELSEVGEAVGMYLSQIGLDVKLEPVEYSSVLRPQILARKNYDLYVYGISYAEGLVGWNRWGRSQNTMIMVGEHPWLDEKIAKAAAELDPDKRAKMQTEIGQWYIDNAWSIPIATKDFTFAMNPKKVKDWKLPPLMTYFTGWEYAERAQ